MAPSGEPLVDRRLAAAARELQHAAHAADTATPLSLPQLREDGWQLAQAAGNLTELVVHLAEHTGSHAMEPHAAERPEAAATLGQASRELADVRQASERLEEAARDYYTALSRITDTPPEPASSEQQG